MRAHVGNRLVPDGDHARAGMVIGSRNADGCLPYIVRWVSDGHIADVVLLHVTPGEIPATAHGAYAGLLGRGHPERDPGRRVEQITAQSARDLLRAAAQRLARPCTRLQRSGHPEREVVAAAESASLLILARDGDRRHRGPKSLGKASRFVVDHAPCPVLLVWPGPPPPHAMPPPPPHRPHARR